MMFETIFFYSLIGIYLFFGLYINYMIIRDDIREQRERKAKLKEGDVNEHR